MADVTPLVRITGQVHGIRTQQIDSRAAVYDDDGNERYPAREASSYDEVGVAVRGRFGSTVTQTNTGTLAVVIGEDDPRPEAGDEVDWLVAPYVRTVNTRKGWFRVVAYRFAGCAGAAGGSVEAGGPVEVPRPRSLAAAGAR